MIDKFLFHRILALFTLFCVSLTACATAPVLTVTPTTLARTATATATLVTETPTTVPTPTEIPVGALNPSHPEAGPRPAGETVYFDIKTNEWAKPNPENPDKPFYQKYLTDPNTGELLKQGWFTNIGEVPSLMEEGANLNFKLPVNFWCSEGQRCATISHDPSKNIQTTYESFTKTVYRNLLNRVMGKTSQDFNTASPVFWKDLGAGNVVLQYTTPRGTFEFKVNTKIGIQPSINVFVVDESTFDTVTPDLDKKFWKSITTSDKDGSANILVSTQNKKKPMQSMTTEGFRDLVMFPVAQFIVMNNQDTNGYLNYVGSGLSDIMDWSTKVFNGSGPFLEITYPAK